MVYPLPVACRLQSTSGTYYFQVHPGHVESQFVSHLQALMYPLLVACKSQSTSRRAAAMAVVDNVRLHSATLVQQAQLVSQNGF